MSDPRFDQLRLLEAALFAADAPRTSAELARHLPANADADDLLAELQAQYASRGVVLKRIGNAWAFRTAEDLAGRLQVAQVQTRKLSRAAVETLAIVAYHQPVTRGEIEEIRGVGLSKGTLDVLLEAGWIKPKGRRQSPGRPLTWATTREFLDHFGLSNLSELPGMEELKAAGLLDTRPALTALAARGELSGDEGADSDEARDEGAAGEGDALDSDFGEDLVPPEAESNATAED